MERGIIRPAPLYGQRATRDNKADLFGFSTRQVLITQP